MRVLHVTESRSWSGGTVQLWALCRGLSARGHAAALFCPPESELAKRLTDSSVAADLYFFHRDYDLFAARRLAAFIKEFKPDIVHAHHPRAHAVCLAASFFTPMPRLVVSRRVSFRLKKWNLFSHWKYRSSRIAAFTAVSEDIRQALLEGGVGERKIHVIHSGVDTERFSPRPPNEALRAELNIPAGVPVAGNLTHYSWWKGQATFLEAARKVLDKGVKAHFFLAGRDTDGCEARKKVRKLGLDGNVTLAGFRSDMPEVLSLLNVSVLSSLEGEGFSGVLREAMSLGVPVVATDVGGNRELVKDGQTGLLVPPGDAETLAKAIGRMIAEPDLARSCARAAQENVRQNYSIQTMVDKTVKLYETLLAK